MSIIESYKSVAKFQNNSQSFTEMMARNAEISHINERRLRPIYDCLDNGNNKKALQEADKVLKKQKDLTCAKVLKALALLRLGRQEDSLQILYDVHSESPIEDSTLQAMTICYRELHKIDLIADAYENAIKKDPNNEELHSHLFMAYVRLSNYKKQQMTAMGLYKIKSKNPYYFWAVMSILMQAITSKDQSITQKITLPLAEKMCQKFADENKIEAEAEVELYLLILEKQKKYNEMLALIDSPIGAKLNNNLGFITKKKADLLKHLERYEEAFETYKQLIDNNIDQMDYYSEIIKLAVILDDELDKKLNGDQKHCSSHNLSLVLTFIEECIQRGTDGSTTSHRLRSPYLAKMDLFDILIRRQQSQGDVDHLIKRVAKSMTDLLFEYFVDFGTKQAIMFDIIYVLDKSFLSDEELQNLVLQMRQSISDVSNDYNELKSLHKHIVCHYICHYLGQNDQLDRESRLKLVNHLNECYKNYYKNIVSISEITPTEQQPTDPYAILMANILFLDKDLDDSLISQTVVILEKVLASSPSNFYIKLMLIKLYNTMGAVGASHTLIESLDIKHIMYDTLGYLFTSKMVTGAHFTASSQLLGHMLKFYSANFKDTLEYLISCYKYGSFTKVEEILNLRERLNNSLQYCLSAVERMILDLILEPKNHTSTENIINYMEIDVENDKFVWSDICDNRDFSVINSYHQNKEKLLKEKQMQTFNDEILWLKIRNLLIRVIASSHNLNSDVVIKKETTITNNTVVDGQTNGTLKRNSADVLSNLSLKFRDYIDCMHSSKFADSLVSLEGPHQSRIVSFSKFNYFEVLITLIDFIIAVNNDAKEDAFTTDVKSADIFSSIVNSLENMTSKTTTLLSIQTTLEQLTNIVETLSISIIFMGICQSIMKSKMNISNKKIRRKKDTTGTADDIINSYVKTYVSLVSKFEESAQRLDKLIKTLNISSVFSERFSSCEITDSESIVDKIKDNVTKSYNQSIKELSTLIQNKILYLHSLRL